MKKTAQVVYVTLDDLRKRILYAEEADDFDYIILDHFEGLEQMNNFEVVNINTLNTVIDFSQPNTWEPLNPLEARYFKSNTYPSLNNKLTATLTFAEYGYKDAPDDSSTISSDVYSIYLSKVTGSVIGLLKNFTSCTITCNKEMPEDKYIFFRRCQYNKDYNYFDYGYAYYDEYNSYFYNFYWLDDIRYYGINELPTDQKFLNSFFNFCTQENEYYDINGISIGIGTPPEEADKDLVFTVEAEGELNIQPKAVISKLCTFSYGTGSNGLSSIECIAEGSPLISMSYDKENWYYFQDNAWIPATNEIEGMSVETLNKLSAQDLSIFFLSGVSKGYFKFVLNNEQDIIKTLKLNYS